MPFPGTQKEANRAAYFNMLLEKLETLEGEDLIHEAKWCIKQQSNMIFWIMSATGCHFLKSALNVDGQKQLFAFRG